MREFIIRRHYTFTTEERIEADTPEEALEKSLANSQYVDIAVDVLENDHRNCLHITTTTTE